MVRLFALATFATSLFAASLIVLSAQVSASTTCVCSDDDFVVRGSSRCSPSHCGCPSGRCRSNQHWTCLITGKRLPFGNPFGCASRSKGRKTCIFDNCLTGRFRNNDLLAFGVQPVMIPIPVGPPPNSFIEGIFAPQQYQRVQPMVGGFGFPPGHHAHGFPPGQPVHGHGIHGHGVHGHGSTPGQAAVIIHGFPPEHPFHAQLFPPLQAATIIGQGVASGQPIHGQIVAPGHPLHGQTFLPEHVAMLGHHGLPPGMEIQGGGQGMRGMRGFGQVEGHVNERIVYVPYAMPPQITVERLASRALKPLNIRRMLGDARMHAYPEMPMNLYTTRGPRDFLAPNPPSIGF